MRGRNGQWVVLLFEEEEGIGERVGSLGLGDVFKGKKLRRRELAMLRSVGMSEHDFQKMMNFECAFMA
ncbi:hypothetical protein BGV03_18530 [Clostridioides difficile]|uniref:hypothetical protein n=1 Tax=Clostridioides difficile TaxID=1496 RepID=UPI000BD1BC2E|nr:hypothetical protein [Clostridioides difficile]PBG69456.1 hypothetical protein BGV03_18530 [Clostridioides difficile]